MGKAIRKINVPAGKAKPVVINTGKDRFKVSTKSVAASGITPDIAKRAAKPVQVPAPKPRVATTSRVTHNVASLYTGPSTGLNRRKSRTVLDLNLFNTKPDYILSSRSELVAETIKKEYGNKPFSRANLDAGILKHLLMKGFVEPVSGSGDESTILRFTKQGMNYHRKSA